MVNCSWKFSSRHSSSDKFLRVKPDCKLKVRLIEDPVKVIRIFSDDRKCAVIDSEDVGRRLISIHPHKLSSVNIRYASWCIDRDDNKMKILDMPQSVARTFGTRADLIDCNISGIVDGCDWSIITNGQQGKDVRYEAVYIKETPLSCAERAMVEDHKSEKYGHFDLTKIFKSCSFEEAENKLFG